MPPRSRCRRRKQLRPHHLEIGDRFRPGISAPATRCQLLPIAYGHARLPDSSGRGSRAQHPYGQLAQRNGDLARGARARPANREIPRGISNLIPQRLRTTVASPAHALSASAYSNQPRCHRRDHHDQRRTTPRARSRAFRCCWNCSPRSSGSAGLPPRPHPRVACRVARLVIERAGVLGDRVRGPGQRDRRAASAPVSGVGSKGSQRCW